VSLAVNKLDRIETPGLLDTRAREKERETERERQERERHR